MISIYHTTFNLPSRDFLFRVLDCFYGLSAPTLSFGEHGKPFIQGGPFFSLSHSGDILALAVADTEVGLDVEKIRPFSAYSPVYNSLIQAEREGIGDSSEKFFSNWTAKEAYIKYLGESVRIFRRLAFYKEALYLDGMSQPVFLTSGKLENGVFTLCSSSPQKINFVRL